ncbi:hypothetical protein LTR78_005590 [Recurvomyces mirabilis]|uniref:Integral membrane bound transporter domain-containing protein n=1 Tax=Recurvomyces mirabilis TaxID=574656 RepID=A0AAE1C1C8_9PEZI|nr:hypothetical protein LTR78_005590 [Recurvomyces mirabilis]KAK5151289.1 hypothetical protein LTS14_009459 [Recurvomyces mirabilis]
MAASNGGASSPALPENKGRFWNRRLRRASFISPSTGERSKRTFTLREATHRLSGDDETTPLLDDGATANRQGSSKWLHFQELAKQQTTKGWQFATSKTGLGIFKCALAYLIGSLATFVPAIAGFIGDRQDSKHMVATVTVWFHPARSIGSMHEATVLAVIALLYSAFVSFTSMTISMLFGRQDLLAVGHAIVLVVFIGGGLGLVAWVKQRLGHPLVNVACSLASLGCITVLIKEGAVQAGSFSHERVLQVLFMVVMGVVIVTAVNILVLPTTARGSLVKDVEKNTDLLADILISITRAFLSGRRSDLEDEYYKKLTSDQQASSGSMSKNLGEAKRELCLLGKERQYDLEARIVDCLIGLAQDLGGLRSAAFAQFSFMDDAFTQPATNGNVNGTMLPTKTQDARPNILDRITEDPEDDTEGVHRPSVGIDTAITPDRRASIDSITYLDTPMSMKSPGDMFLAFIAQLGPPTKSLVYTIKQILDELPFQQKPNAGIWSMYAGVPNVEVAVNENFHSSLQRAIEMYRQARADALRKLHASRAINAAGLASQQGGKGAKAPSSFQISSPAKSTMGETRLEAVLADIEEVSACCGHFSFSLLDFAEDVLTYLKLLEDLKAEMQTPRHSWRWLAPWWPRGERQHSTDQPLPSKRFHDHSEEYDMPRDIPAHVQQADAFADPEKASANRPWSYSLYRALHIFRRDDVRFAIKVGLGALLYALPAFLPETRPFFVHWRGEWGLVSYMAVCSMTVGASNTTSIKRLIGTCIGALLAIVAWVVSSDHGDANPWLLGFFGWLMALGCFYLMLALGEGPMARFILLTYNLGALYSYSLSIRDDDNDDDEGGIDPAIWSIVLHRLVAVIVGCLWAIVITRFIWPISARRKLKDGLCVLWLRMGLVWKRDPLAMFLLGEPRSSYMDIREEATLQSFLSNLEGLRKAATSEWELRGPFPDKLIGRILERTGRMLDAFHAMNVVISKNLQYTPGEAAVLRYTRPERFALSARISHLFSVLASSVKLEYPLNDVLPSIDHTRDRLLAKISEFRQGGEGRDITTEQDYELLYAYVLVTGQLSEDIQAVSAEIETLYGTLNEDNFKLQ